MRTFWTGDEIESGNIPDGAILMHREVTACDARLFIKMREKDGSKICKLGSTSRPQIGDLIIISSSDNKKVSGFFSIVRARWILATSDGKKCACVDA